MTLVTSSPDIRFQTTPCKNGIRVGRADEKPRKEKRRPHCRKCDFFRRNEPREWRNDIFISGNENFLQAMRTFGKK
jgi:hypothetical protein